VGEGVAKARLYGVKRVGEGCGGDEDRGRHRRNSGAKEWVRDCGRPSARVRASVGWEVGWRGR
jgi:hypothetical protein